MKTISEQFNDRFYKQDNYGMVYSKDGKIPIAKKGYDQLEAIKEFYDNKMTEMALEMRFVVAYNAGVPLKTTKEILKRYDEIIKKYI